MCMTSNELNLFAAVRRCLTANLVPVGFRDKPESPYYGHCFHASIALYKLLSGKSAGYRVCRAKDDAGVTHYWVRAPGGYVIDPTADQYTSFGQRPPYNTGTSTGFRPTRAVQQIISCVQGDNNA